MMFCGDLAVGGSFSVGRQITKSFMFEFYSLLDYLEKKVEFLVVVFVATVEEECIAFTALKDVRRTQDAL